MIVKLFTSNNQFVAEWAIPPFYKWPDVLFWGTRVFKFECAMIEPIVSSTTAATNIFDKYTECFAYHLITEEKNEVNSNIPK